MNIIERKGIGHPDTIADDLGEALADMLIAIYKDEYGEVQHYNVDKVLVSAGEIEEGEFIKNPTIVFAGQYTKIGKNIDEMLRAATYMILEHEIKLGMKPEILNLLNEGSSDLRDNYGKKKCNDTSFAVGSPLDKDEEFVLKLGKYLDELHQIYAVGRDNKIMFIDDDKEKKIYIALAVLNSANYEKIVEHVKNDIKTKFKVDVIINASGPFTTKTGTSLEQGDSGMTGRGNRRNGLITPLKPQTLEAYYGKNRQTHIGRMYQDMAIEMAKEKGKSIIMVNNIGGEIDKPTVISIEVKK